MPLTYDALAEPMFVEYDHDGKLAKRINLNHPWTIRPTTWPETHAGLMVFGSKHPKHRGEYYNVHGGPVPVAVAELAGFPVETDLAEKRKTERQKQAMAAIEAEFHKTPETVIAEQSGYKLIDVGLGEAIIRGPDNSKLTPNRMSHAVAKKYFLAMTAEVGGKPDDA